MANVETAQTAKRVGRVLLRWGLIFFVAGAGTVLMVLMSAGRGPYATNSTPRLAVMAGIVVALYLGFLPILVGAVLWIGGRVMERRALDR